MPFLPGLALVFVGISGDDSARVDQQVHLMLQEQDVRVVKLDPRRRSVLARHRDGSREIVRELHADGVVGGELIADHGHRTLRMVVYSGDGAMKSLFEVPVNGRQLSRDEVAMLHSNIADDLESLGHHEPTPVEPPQRTAAVEPPKVALEPKQIAKPIIVAKVDPKPAPKIDDQIEMDEPPAHPAAPVETAEVGVEDLMAATAASDTEVTATTTVADRTLRIGAAVGLGVTGRTFAAGPSTVAGYSSAAVPIVHLDAHVQPTEHTVLTVGADRTLAMTSPQSDGDAATTMSRWEATAGYELHRGGLRVTPLVGAGRRAFAIVSNDPARSPDNTYDYLVAGGRAELAIGSRIAVRAHVAFEPVVGGVEPTEMVLGEATRWALDVGGGIEVRPHAHVFVRAAADYQRFAWSWGMAGARGAGGAVDHYPSGTLSLGADY